MIAEAIHNENLDCGFFSICSRRLSAGQKYQCESPYRGGQTSLPGRCHSVPCGSIAENLGQQSRRMAPVPRTSSKPSHYLVLAGQGAELCYTVLVRPE